MLFVYMLKVGLCLIVFYLVWKWLLSRETWHRLNRVLLLAMTVAAFVLPWVRLSVSRPSPVGAGLIEIGELLAVGIETPAQPKAEAVSPLSLAYIIYIMGAVALLLWRLWTLFSLWRLMRRGRTERLADGSWLHVLAEDVSPFCYFRHIVISEGDVQTSRREILTHEQAHIRLGHSWDVLLMDLVLIAQWWNPAAWLLRRELKQVHEYEADEAVLERGVDARQYQLLLIRKSVGDQLFSMANNLNYQSLKKRIRMMTRKRSSRWQLLRALAIVPVAAALAVACGQKSEKAEEPLTVAVEVPGATAPDVAVVGQAQDDVFDVVEEMPEFPGGTAELMQFLSRNMKYPKEAEKAGEQGRVIANFVVEPDGSVTNAQVVKSVSPQLDAEALRVIGLMPRWQPGRQNGKAVRVKYTIPITFSLN